MSNFKLGGLIAAPYTAFDANGDLKLSTIEKQCASLLSNGVKGAFVCGTTGEGLSLTTSERMQVAQRWAEVTGGLLHVIVHVGHNSQRDAMALAKHAHQIGASAIAAMPPFFFKPSGPEAIVDFMRPIAAAGGDLPFYYYNIPSMTGVSLPVVDFLALAQDRIPNLHGVKYTHGDQMDYLRCQRFNDGKYEIAWGVDEMLLGALAVGATSAVGSTYNYAAPLYTRMIAAYRSGDLDTARLCASRSAEMIAVLLKNGVLRTGKATMTMIGVDCGPVRSPISPLTREEVANIQRTYERMGFFEWARHPQAAEAPAVALAAK